MDLTRTSDSFENIDVSQNKTFRVPRTWHYLIREMWVTVPESSDTSLQLVIGGNVIFKINVADLAYDEYCLWLMNPSQKYIIHNDQQVSINMLQLLQGLLPVFALDFHAVDIFSSTCDFTVRWTGSKLKNISTPNNPHGIEMETFDTIVRRSFKFQKLIYPLRGWIDLPVQEWHHFTHQASRPDPHRGVTELSYIFRIVEGDLENIETILAGPHTLRYDETLHGYELLNASPTIVVSVVYKDPSKPVKISVRKLMQKTLVIDQGMGMLLPYR